MPERKAQKIADAADMIVGGYAMMRHKQGIRIVNLFSGHVALVSPKYEILATDMDGRFIRVEAPRRPDEKPASRHSGLHQEELPCNVHALVDDVGQRVLRRNEVADETVGAATFLSPQKWRSEPTASGDRNVAVPTSVVKSGSWQSISQPVCDIPDVSRNLRLGREPDQCRL